MRILSQKRYARLQKMHFASYNKQEMLCFAAENPTDGTLMVMAIMMMASQRAMFPIAKNSVKKLFT